MRARNLTREADLAERVEVATSLWAKFMGLMGRPSLPPGDGLWLASSNGIHMFFMRFPIDAVFLSKAGASAGAGGGAGAGSGSRSGAVSGGAERRVVSISRNLPAWRGIVPFVRGADGVLEFPAGTIAATRTVVGDVVLLE